MDYTVKYGDGKEVHVDDLSRHLNRLYEKNKVEISGLQQDEHRFLTTFPIHTRWIIGTKKKLNEAIKAKYILLNIAKLNGVTINNV